MDDLSWEKNHRAEGLKAEGLVAGRPISPGTKVKAYVRRFETPTALNDGRPALARDYGNMILF